MSQGEETAFCVSAVLSEETLSVGEGVIWDQDDTMRMYKKMCARSCQYSEDFEKRGFLRSQKVSEGSEEGVEFDEG